MRRTLAALVLLLACVLAGCTDAPVPTPTPTAVATQQPQRSQLVIGVDALPAGFNPHLLAHLSPVTTALATLVLPSVFRPDADGTPRLDTTVASSATVVSHDPFTVSYELNLQASWTSNAPIAAEDFVYLWERMRREPGVADAAGYQLITEVRSRAGGKAVDVVFARPYPPWRSLFSGLLPASILKDAPGSWTGALTGGLPASGGPFRIARVDRGRGEVVLTRNDLYWGTPTVLDELVLAQLDPAAMTEGLAAGEVAVALPTALPDMRAALAALSPAPHLQQAPQPTVTQLGLRADAGPLVDPRVRQALGAIIDRPAVRAAVAPDALAADAFGLAPSQPGYAPTAPPSQPARPDPALAQRLLTEAGWTRDAAGRWDLGRPAQGGPPPLVVGAAAERPLDVRVAQVVVEQLTAAGVPATVVAPAGSELFGRATVTATPPSAPPTPARATAAGPTTPAAAATPATATTGAPAPATDSSGGVRVDVLVMPRSVGGDLGSELASNYGCPTTTLPDPPASPTGFCFAPLQPLLDELTSANPTAGLTDVVERMLWAQLPALPLFQPVTLVVSTRASDAATGVGPGPLPTGPVTGAERWRQPAR